MKAQLTARAALALGWRSLARDAARFGHERRDLFAVAQQDAARGSSTATLLLICLVLAGL